MHWRTSLSASCSRTCCGQKGQGREDRVPGHNQAHIQSMWCLTSDRLGICSNRRESGHHTRSSPNPAQGVGERGGRWSTANWWPVPSISAKVSVAFWSSLSSRQNQLQRAKGNIETRMLQLAIEYKPTQRRTVRSTTSRTASHSHESKSNTKDSC